MGNTGLTQGCHHGICTGRKHIGSTGDDFPEIVVIQRDQRQQLLVLLGRKIRSATLKQARKN